MRFFLFEFFCISFCFFFFNDTATTEIYTLSLHDALPILGRDGRLAAGHAAEPESHGPLRSEEHTSELQSHHDLVCRLLLEKKKQSDSMHRDAFLEENETQCYGRVDF